ncbi:uncharacterized protein LOC107306637 isoform X3 [Coturnix japonica]|uniref:uncharacterized protein LOC107306637 isoform X3 n=1 Tax=Coturnix japonica TaxID=93934 RepID=UPI0013A5D36E|nr:uncharacterized protein LOC107306637 isoform X3 [Coturnix japonica]
MGPAGNPVPSPHFAIRSAVRWRRAFKLSRFSVRTGKSRHVSSIVCCRFKHTFQERGERRLRVGRGTLGCPPLHPPPGFMRLRRAAQPCPGAHVEVRRASAEDTESPSPCACGQTVVESSGRIQPRTFYLQGSKVYDPPLPPRIEHNHNSMQTVGRGVFHVAADDRGDVPLLSAVHTAWGRSLWLRHCCPRRGAGNGFPPLVSHQSELLLAQPSS